MSKLLDAPSSGTPDSRPPEMGATPPSVLVVDDEKNIRTTLSVCLEQLGCRVTAVGAEDRALEALERAPFDLAFVDLKLGEASGLDLIPKLLALRPDLSIVMITAYATFDTAVDAIKRGAQDYLPKPFTPAQIRHVVDHVIERRGLARRVTELEGQLASELPEIVLDTDAPAMRSVLDVLRRAAGSDAPILLRGENGTGKGVLARAVHRQSKRASGPFVTVNCPTLSDELLASELFGHTKGAFTGAVRDQAGRVEAAERGTLFLDEIGEVSPGLQAKLLRFLQEKEFERVGENRTRRADVRVIAATNRDLEKDVRDGRFREDLLFRLNVIEVKVPALRERTPDIVRLARAFVAFFARAASRAVPELSPEAEATLVNYPWPGNVRELKNAMERALILWPTQRIGPEALPGGPAATATHVPTLGGDFSLEQIEREHIMRTLERIPTLEDAAGVLGIDASTLWRKRRKYDG